MNISKEGNAQKSAICLSIFVCRYVDHWNYVANNLPIK